jgi:hypothetical protein
MVALQALGQGTLVLPQLTPFHDHTQLLTPVQLTVLPSPQLREMLHDMGTGAGVPIPVKGPEGFAVNDSREVWSAQEREPDSAAVRAGSSSRLSEANRLTLNIVAPPVS